MGSTPSTSPARRQNGFEKKLAAYLLAGGALLATAEDGRAEVIYSGPQNIPIGPNSTVNLDLNGDGVVDYSFTNFTESAIGFKSELDLNLHGTNQAAADSSGYPLALPAGQPVPDSLSFTSTTPSAKMAKYKSGPGFLGGNWNGVSNLYLGLQFSIGGQTHYGWAELSVLGDGSSTGTLEGWAYENVAGAPILTGQTSGGAGVPEPTSLLLLALGAAGLEVYRRRRKNASETASQCP